MEGRINKKKTKMNSMIDDCKGDHNVEEEDADIIFEL